MVSTKFLAAASLALSSFTEAREAPKRPDIQPSPHQPFKSFPSSVPRSDKTCFVKPSCSGGDDATKILNAMEECNNGGTVVLDKDYKVCSRLDLRFLKHIDIALTGSITFCDDLDVWTSDYIFQFPFQDQGSWWLWGGEDINLYGLGTGTINGNGQVWYDAYAADGNRDVQRPLLFVTDGWHGGSITGLNMRASPQWFYLIANSSNILISDLDMYSRSDSEWEAKNLDGFDVYRSDNIVIQNSYLDHDDDCVSFKPNSTNILVQGLVCNNSHGVSVGSLGQYPGVFDVVENLYIYNISMSNASDSARIKVWPGEGAETNPGWIGGGGAGIVRNVTYEHFFVDNNDAALAIDQCKDAMVSHPESLSDMRNTGYGAINARTCQENPSLMVITDVVFKDFYGVTSKKSDPIVGSLICSDENSCDNIQAHNITVEPPSGKPAQWRCRNMVEDLLDLNGVGCVAA